MPSRFWVVGPIAWDTVLLVPRLPDSGGFVQADDVSGRPGGAGANVAVALASAGVDVAMVGYLGRDAEGERLRSALRAAGVGLDHVEARDGRSSHVLLFIEPSGERTIVGLWPDQLAEVAVPTDAVAAGDVVYVAGWRAAFAPALRALLDKGAIVACVPPEGAWADLPATYVVGSERQLEGADPMHDERYRRQLADGSTRAVLVTRGARGVRIHRAGGYADRPALRVDAIDAIDATGAGDAFAAGFLLLIGSGAGVDDAARAGIAWAAATVSLRQSHPPPWADVAPLLR
jgi:sugar/nucleoside kinase (ribokinase family)